MQFKFCPIARKTCRENDCALFDICSQQCSILQIAHMTHDIKTAAKARHEQ